MLGADVRMIPVEVGLLGREQVEVPVAGRAVRVRRCASRCGRRELGRASPSAARRRLGRGPARNQKRVALRRAGAGRERRLEPGVPVGDVVGDDVDDRPDPEVERLGDQRLGLLERAEGRVDRPVVGDVVAAVGERREVPRA